MAKAAEFLVRAQNADGGWGYRVGGMSFVEPTASVLLALSDLGLPNDHTINQTQDRACVFLISLQHADGGWGVGAVDAESGWMTAWAAFALARMRPSENTVDRGVHWLLLSEGIRVAEETEQKQVRELFRIDSTLNGFPWQPGDAAWVHPTALAVLALCAAGKRQDNRTREGVAFLLDRAVDAGGWNIGNPQMVGKPMAATVQDTAVALLALRAANEPAEPRITRALSFLNQAVLSSNNASELAWATYALQEWQSEHADAKKRLTTLQREDGSWSGNPFVTAIALLAGTGS